MTDTRIATLNKQIEAQIAKRDAAEIAASDARFAGDARAMEQSDAQAKSARSKIERLEGDLKRHGLKLANIAARKGGK